MEKAKLRAQQSYLCDLWRVKPKSMANYAKVATLGFLLSSDNVGSSRFSAVASQLECQQAVAKHSISAGPHFDQ